MTHKDFDLACQRVEILDPDEVNLIQEAFKTKSSSSSSANVTDEQAQMLTNFRKPRPKYARMPVHLSERSNPKNYPKKMRKYEQSFDEGSQCSVCLYLCCGWYAFICD